MPHETSCVTRPTTTTRARRGHAVSPSVAVRGNQALTIKMGVFDVCFRPPAQWHLRPWRRGMQSQPFWLTGGAASVNRTRPIILGAVRSTKFFFLVAFDLQYLAARGL